MQATCRFNPSGFMVLTLLVFLHLLATCAAIGTIVITDMRLVAKMLSYRVVIPRPERFETVMVSVSLLLLYLSGIALVWMQLADNPNYLANGKLQGKLVLVGLLTLNAFVLHFKAFPILGLSWPISRWTRTQWLTVATSVSLSNSLWLFCAFLGVARVWNFTVSLWFVLTVAAVVWLCMFVLANTALAMGSRDAPKTDPDWVDMTIATVSDLARLTSHSRPGPIDAAQAGSGQPGRSRRAEDRRSPAVSAGRPGSRA